jgi:hypothetical protein
MQKDISKYSDPARVQQLATQYLGNGAKVYLSSKKDKKYMVFNPSGAKVHFGQMGFQDFTKSKDTKKRDLFKKRNAKWAKASKWSPAWLSYWLLW